MNAKELMEQVVKSFRSYGGHIDRRGYLGMSGIGGCPRQQYFSVVNPEEADDRLQWYGWTGYTHEAAIKNLLGQQADAVLTMIFGGASMFPEAMIKLKPKGFNLEASIEGDDSTWPRELMADFDSRYRGHVDIVLLDGTLVDVKSVGPEKFVKLKRDGRGQYTHVCQMQAYMEHGPFHRGILLYVARNLPHFSWQLPFWCVDVPRDEMLMKRLDEKAKSILAAIDADEPPTCQCRWCKR